MDEDDILELERRREEEINKRNIFDDRFRRIERISAYLPKPLGLFRKRCPHCNSVLVHHKKCSGDWIATDINILYECKCGYEYAVRKYH